MEVDFHSPFRISLPFISNSRISLDRRYSFTAYLTCMDGLSASSFVRNVIHSFWRWPSSRSG